MRAWEFPDSLLHHPGNYMLLGAIAYASIRRMTAWLAQFVFFIEGFKAEFVAALTGIR